MNTHIVYEPELDSSRAQWAIRNCIGPRSTLHSIVPAGFEKYVRICQPGWFWQHTARSQEQIAEVDDYENRIRSKPVRWRDVALENAKTAHRLMQWHSIAPPCVDVRSGRAGYSAPYDGEITSEIMESVFEVFLRHTDVGQACICAFWQGSGIFDHLKNAARVEGIGQQSHILFSTTLEAVRDQWRLVLKHARETAGLTPQAIWPTNQNWYDSVPFEMHASYFGGPTSMADEILNAPALESFEVFAGDDIWNDTINA